MLFIRKNRSGFTLIELLIVAAMLGVVSLAIYSTFNNGLKLWQKVNKPVAGEDADIFFEQRLSLRWPEMLQAISRL